MSCLGLLGPKKIGNVGQKTFRLYFLYPELYMKYTVRILSIIHPLVYVLILLLETLRCSPKKGVGRVNC